MSNRLEEVLHDAAREAQLDSALEEGSQQETVVEIPRQQESDDENDDRQNNEQQDASEPKVEETEATFLTTTAPEEEEEDEERMELSDDEHQWACAIKAAIESDPELDNLSDFLYAQIALMDRDNVEAALERAEAISALRQEYKVIENLQQGQRAYQAGIRQFPGFFLNISFRRDEEGTGSYILVVDKTKMTSDTLQGNSSFDIWWRAAFFQFHAANPDFESMREGVTILVECDGFDMKKQFGLKVFSKMWRELGLVYPVNIQKVKHYHTPMMANMLVSLAKRVLPLEVHRRFEVGLVCPAGRLSNIYLSPNLQAANQRLMGQFTRALRLRYKNEASFSLSERQQT